MKSKNITGFLYRRNPFFIAFSILLLFLVCEASAEEAIQFSFGSSSKLEITERSNIRVSENGIFSGLTYNESRAVLGYMWYEDGYSRYAGNYYVYEASKKDTRLISNPIDINKYCEIDIDDQGHYRMSDDELVPVLRSFPVFPNKEIIPGDKWRDFGTRIIDPDNSGKYTKVKFYCEYRYDGLQDSKTGLKHVVTAQYAMRYRLGDSDMYDPDLKELTGRHLVTILIDDEQRSSIFIRDKLDESYVYSDGRIAEHSGFILTWYNDIVGMNRTEIAESTRAEIINAAIEDVDVIEKSEGIALSIQNLHFVPDSAEILPQESSRITSIFTVLKNIDVKRILVAGHTADVGTKESQYDLSEKRALTVIDMLTSLGMNPGTFIYEGRGGDEPIADNNTEFGRSKNRRVELIILDD